MVRSGIRPIHPEEPLMATTLLTQYLEAEHESKPIIATWFAAH